MTITSPVREHRAARAALPVSSRAVSPVPKPRLADESGRIYSHNARGSRVYAAVSREALTTEMVKAALDDEF